MKILIFHTYNQGYLSGFFHELSVKLIENGHDVVCFSWKGSVSERVIDGVKINIKKKKGYITNYRNVYSVIKKERPDVILSNFSYVNPALLFGKLFGVKKNMVWFHSLNDQMESSKLNIFVKKQFLKLANVVIANSYLTKKELELHYAVPENKIEAIPFWSNIAEKQIKPSELKFTTKQNVVKIGCPGRMAAHKNQKIVIEALSIINQKYDYDFHLYFAGSGEELTNLESDVDKKGLKSKVTFLKHIPSNDMIAFYNAMDVIVLPSLHEAFGLVFIEAIALGTPVIVSSQFGALTFIKNKEDLRNVTFNPKSSEDLILKLKPYFSNNGLTSDYFKKLYDQNFDKDIIYDRIQNIILEK